MQARIPCLDYGPSIVRWVCCCGVIRLYAYETDDCRADYKNDYSGAISEDYVPRSTPAFYDATEIDIRSRSPVYERLLTIPI
jgi:hypothetical protein